MTLAADLETLLEELYNSISEILATEKLSSAARTALGSIKNKIHVHKTARATHSAEAAPPIPLKEDATDLPEYGEAEEMPEYEDFTATNATIHLPLRKAASEASISIPKSPSPSPAEEVTVQTLLNTAVMHGILFRRDRKYMLEQCRKCWAAATPTTFHLFNSEADAKPAVSVLINGALEIKVPQDGSKDKKKDVTFELISGSKRYKLVAPSPNERHSWLTVLNKGVPFSTVVYDTTRSLPETPLDAIETFEIIQEDNDSLENYEIMSTPGQAEDEDIYNSLEDLAPPQVKATPAPTISMMPPALPQTKRPSLLALKKANAPAPPSPTEELYDDTCNVATSTPQLPNRIKGAPPPPPIRKNSTTLQMEIYDEAGSRDDVYDDAGAQVSGMKPNVINKITHDVHMPLVAIKNHSILHMEIYDEAGSRDDLYDDACGAAAVQAKPVPKAPAKMAKPPPPLPPVKKVSTSMPMEIYDDVAGREEVYDDTAGNDDDDQGVYYDIEEMAQSVRAQNKKPSDDIPPPLPPMIAAMKSPGSKPPEPPSPKNKPETHLRKFIQAPQPEPEGEDYDEVGPTLNVVPPPLPAPNAPRPQNKPSPPPMIRKLSATNLMIQQDETYDLVAPPTDLASDELGSVINNLNKQKNVAAAAGSKPQSPPAPSSKAKPAPPEDIRDASTLLKQLSSLKPPANLVKAAPEKKIEIIKNSAVHSGNEGGRPAVSLAQNMFKQADSAALKKFNQPPADQAPVAKINNHYVPSTNTNGVSPVKSINKPVTRVKPTVPSTNNKPTVPSTNNKPTVPSTNNKPTAPSTNNKPTPMPNIRLALKSRFEAAAAAPQNNATSSDVPPAPRGIVRNLAQKIGGQLGQ